MSFVLLAQDDWWGGGWVFFVLFALLLTVLVFKVFVFSRWSRARGWPDTSPETILKRRLASGEISESDYRRLKEVLTSN
jgi:uncharacterized membrane protein